MIYRSPNSIGSLFLIVQSEELLLLKPVIFTKNSMVHEENCKQKVIFIQCSQRVLYVHACMVLSIIRAWLLFYVKHVLQYVNGHAGTLVKEKKNVEIMDEKF
jgi:hypothetical protein